MSPGSKAFLLFLLIVVAGYHILRGRTAKYRFLLLSSWVFYAICSPRYLWVLLLLTVIDFIAGRRIEANTEQRLRKRWLILSIVANLGLLFSFKYVGFVWDTGSVIAGWCGFPVPDRAWEILLPLGISFHTFQGISYTVDIYRREIRAVDRFLDYALFVAFFPQMAAGPIVRAMEFLPQMATPPVPTTEQIRDGMYLFVRGLFKKLVIADQLDQLFVSAVFAEPTSFSPDACRWATIAWAVQIYCDFSGYTDIALGTAKWFGFELPANFHLPYLATSITDFWRRWHLSLSTWLRDYLYFPLGGSRGSEIRTYLNLMTIFILCGLWHGATWSWLIYGLYNGVLMSAHRAYDRSLLGLEFVNRLRHSMAWAALSWCATMIQLCVGLILIRMNSWTEGRMILEGICGLTFGLRGVPGLVPILIVLGVSDHLRALMAHRLSLPRLDWELLRMVHTTICLASVVVFSPGVAQTFIYIQF